MARLTFEERAARGAALLDKMIPGWARKVRIRKLAMWKGHMRPDECGCVGAQLDFYAGTGEGMYSLTMARLGLTSENQQERHGFDLYDDESYSDRLDEAWKEEIRARR
jgi:hypothetical protein